MKLPIILIHLGNETPAHMTQAIEQLKRSNPDADVRTVIMTRSEAIKGEATALAAKASKLTPNDFWELAYLRLFVLEDYMREQEIDTCVHIENDVAVFCDVATIAEQLEKCYGTKIAINQLDYKNSTAAFAYVGSLHTLTVLNGKLQGIAEKGFEYWRYNGYFGNILLSEMIMLRIAAKVYPELLGYLPVLPDDEYTDKLGGLFDGGSWGQYLGGISRHCWGPGFMSHEHVVGSALRAGIVSCDVGKPPVVTDNRTGKTCVLHAVHVHCKLVNNLCT